jgi:pimeloyl-ACP methyl ester carboxylesterase
MLVYFISGIGADKRIFKNIQLPAGYEPVFLDWIKPLHNESLEHYAMRLAENIDCTQPFVLVGLSFGGMIAVEISKNIPPIKLIIISSIPTYHHLPWYMKLAGILKLNKFVPLSILKSVSLLKRFFTAETPEEKRYLRNAIRNSDTDLIRWSMHAILTWKSKDVPSSYIHIHGTRDFVLPIQCTSPTHRVRGAGHLMILSRANEINILLHAILVSRIPDPCL